MRLPILMARENGNSFYVTLPSMQQSYHHFLLTFIWTFNYFELIYVMTGGGQRKVPIFSLYVYDLAFKRFRFGDASRFAIFDFLFLLIFSLFYVWLSQRQKRMEQ